MDESWPADAGTEPGSYVWAVDDSELDVGGRAHTLLAALTFISPRRALNELRLLRKELGVPDDFEFKWNGRITSPSDRRLVSNRFLRILGDCLGVVTVVEGRERQAAAELVVQQIVDAAPDSSIPIVLFDQGILGDRREFRRFLQRSEDETVRFLQFADVDSATADLVQCADLFAGFMALKIKLATGEKRDPVISDEEGELTLSLAIEWSLRYAVWGTRENDFDPPGNDTPPPAEYWTKRTKGCGLRVHSSVGEDLLEQIYSAAGSFYMGCLH